MFALADCNSFYASCQSLFRPDLRGRPIAILSSNDGCVIARSKELKTLGIPMGMPYFELKPYIKKHNIAVFSSNYALYASLSARVHTVLDSLALRSSIYSIDESWLDVTGIDAVQSFDSFGHHVRNEVFKHTGLMVGVGIAPSKTLAKTCQYASKRWPATKGVVALTDPIRIRKLLALQPIDEIWGIGRKLTTKLNVMGIETALQLADTDVRFIKKNFGVVMERTVRELRGESCIPMEEMVPAKQQIICSRSFGQRISEEHEMRQAICRYAERAGEKLRQEKQFCRHVSVFMRTSPFANEPQSSISGTEKLLTATQDSRDVIAAAQRIIDRIWKPGFRYAKAGVMLNDFSPTRLAQLSLFDDHSPRPGSEALMSVVDKINQEGLGRVWFAGQGIEPAWQMRREMLSPAYTTRWDELPKAKIG
jgi:DNA polymerase V